MSLQRFLWPAFIRPVQPVASNRAMMRRLMSRATAASRSHPYTCFAAGTCCVRMAVVAGVWFDWPVMAAVGTFSRL